MNRIQKKNDTQAAIEELVNELQKSDLWTNELPSTTQLSSKEPFAVDVMPFEQWLQWIFIPQMLKLLDDAHFNGLPHQSDIFSMAEHVFKDCKQNTNDVLNVIQSIDDLLNSFTKQSIH